MKRLILFKNKYCFNVLSNIYTWQLYKNKIGRGISKNNVVISFSLNKHFFKLTF